MQNSQFIEFKPEHLDAMDFGDKQDFVRQMKDAVKSQAQHGHCMALVINGEVIGCGGIYDMWPGVGEVWMATSKRFPKYRYTAMKSIAKFLKMHMEKYHRLQMAVRMDFIQAHNLADHLGFKTEGFMEAYGLNGENFILYARVRKWLN